MDISMDICGKILDISLYPQKDICGRKKGYFGEGLPPKQHYLKMSQIANDEVEELRRERDAANAGLPANDLRELVFMVTTFR